MFESQSLALVHGDSPSGSKRKKAEAADYFLFGGIGLGVHGVADVGPLVWLYLYKLSAVSPNDHRGRRKGVDYGYFPVVVASKLASIIANEHHSGTFFQRHRRLQRIQMFRKIALDDRLVGMGQCR